MNFVDKPHNQKNIRLINDPFLLHTCLEENIGSNVGNDPFLSFNNFLAYTPLEYKYLLTSSSDIIIQIKQFYNELMTIGIKFNKVRGRYNESYESYYDTDTVLSPSEYADIIHKFVEYNTNYKIFVDHDEIFATSLKPIISVPKKPVVGRFSSTLAARSYYDDSDNDSDNQSDNQPDNQSTVSNESDIHYFNHSNDPESGEYISAITDPVIEKIYNEKIDNIVNYIVNESKYKPLFIPIGYSNKNTGHVIGLIIDKTYIAIYNGGEGLNYHYMQDIMKPNKKFPQCIIKIIRTIDSDIYEHELKHMIKNLIIINRIYSNTNINHVYEILFSYYSKYLFYQNFRENIHSIDTFDTSVLNIIKQLFIKHAMFDRQLQHSPIVYEESDDNFSSIKSGLKYPKYIKENSYRLCFSDKLNKSLDTFLRTIFNDRYMQSIKQKSWKQIISDDIGNVNISTNDYIEREINNFFMHNQLSVRLEYNSDYQAIIQIIIREISRNIRNNFKEIIESDEYMTTHQYTIDKYITHNKSVDRLEAPYLFHLYIKLVISKDIDDKQLSDDIEQFNSDNNTDISKLNTSTLNAYNNIFRKLLDFFRSKYSVDQLNEFVSRNFLPIKLDKMFFSQIYEFRSRILLDSANIDNLSDKIINIYTENIIGIKSEELLHKKYMSIDADTRRKININFINDMMFNQMIGVKCNSINKFEFIFNICGKNLKEFDITNTNEINIFHNKLIEGFVESNNYMKTVWTDKKIKSSEQFKGYIREQYSGSCSYNGILLAIADMHNASIDMNQIKILKDKIFDALIKDKIKQLTKNEIILSESDKSIVDAIEINLMTEIEDIIEQLYISDKETTIHYPFERGDMSKQKWDKTKKAYRKKLIKEKNKIIIDHYENKLKLIRQLRQFLPIRQYPTFVINDFEQEQTVNQNTTIQSPINQNIKLYKSLNTINDIISNLNLILHATLSESDRYVELVMNKVINIIRLNDDTDIESIERLYKDVNSYIHTNELGFRENRSIVCLYLLIYCLDKLLFKGYQRSHDSEPIQLTQHTINKENSILCNLILNEYIEDDNLNHLIELIQRYELFYPVNDNKYYSRATTSLRKSLKVLDSTLLHDKIDLSNIKPTNLFSLLLKIPGFVNFMNLITNYFCDSYKDRIYDREKIYDTEQITYIDPNIKLLDRVTKFYNKKHGIDKTTDLEGFSKLTENDDYMDYSDTEFIIYNETTLVTDPYSGQNEKWTLNMSDNNSKLLLFYFELDSTRIFEFFITLTFDTRRNSLTKIIYPNSKILILNTADFEYSGKPEINIYNYSDVLINRLTIYDLHIRKNADYIKLHNNKYTKDIITLYKPRQIIINNYDPILNLENIHRLIGIGDTDEAKYSLEEIIQPTKHHTSGLPKMKAYYCLFPTIDKKIIPMLNLYQINNNKTTIINSLFNTTEYLNYYRSCYDLMMSDAIIIALPETKYIDIYNKLKIVGKLLGRELDPIDDISKADLPKADLLKDSLSDTLTTKPTTIKTKSYQISIDTGIKSQDIDIDTTFVLPDAIIVDDLSKELRINDYKIIKSPSDILSCLKIFNTDKSIGFLRNLEKICKMIPDSFIGYKTDKNTIIQGIVCIPILTERFNKINENAFSFPWNKLDKKFKHNDLDYRYNKSQHNDFIAKKEKIIYVKFLNNNFNSFIPVIDLANTYECEMFVIFFYYLLINQQYMLLNIYLPLFVSIYHNKDNDETSSVYKITKFILDHDYFNSPYNYYFLNKLYLMIHGYNKISYVYNLSKRSHYYRKIYREIIPNTKIIDYDLTQETKLFNTWLSEIKHFKEANIITKVQLNTIVQKLNMYISGHNYKYYQIDVNDVMNQSSLLDFVMIEGNYRKLFINISLDIIDKLRQIVDTRSQITDIEILGNIKYFINDTFDHKISDAKDSENIAAIKLFEIITGKIVDIVQFTFIQNMLSDEKDGKCKLYELLMGRGKSYVIIPCILLTYYYNKKYQNIIQCIPSHLINQSIAEMIKFLPFMTTGYIYNFIIGRNDPEKIKTISSINHSIVSKLIITDDIALKTHILAKIETQQLQKEQLQKEQLQKEQLQRTELYGGGYIEIDNIDAGTNELLQPLIKEINDNRRIKLPDELNIDTTIRDNSIIVIDEFDMLIDPMKSDLNFPVGKYDNVDFQNILIQIILNITQQLFINYHQYMIRSDRTDEKLNKLIVKKIMLDEKNMKYSDLKDMIKTLYATVVKKINKDKHIEQFNILSHTDNQLIKKYYQKDVMSEMSGGNISNSLLLYYIRECYRVYYNALSLLLDKDYGWDSESENNPYIAIPYSAQDTPVKGSQYSEIIINIILTSITYCQKGLRIDKDIKQYIDYIKFCVKRLGPDNTSRELDIDSKLIGLAMIDAHDSFNNYMIYLKKNNYSQYIKAITIYLEKIILTKYVKIDPMILNCSFIDIIDPNNIKNKFALSGTVNVHLPKFKYHDNMYVIRDINKDHITNELINNAFKGNNMNSSKSDSIKTTVKILDTDDNADKIIDIMMTYQVLIDTGSFFRYFTNLMVANKLSIKYPKHTIIYFDDNDKPSVILNQTKIENYDLKTLKREPLYKIYFDQKHTIGTDLDIGSTARGLITVHKFNNRTQIAQGLFRLREINYYQTHDYLIKTDTDQILTQLNRTIGFESMNKLDILIKYLDMNEKSKYESSEYKYLQQTILCLLRTLASYDISSYRIDVWNPSLINDKILIDYNYNFSKEHFISMVKSQIHEFTSMVSKKYIDLSSIQPIIKEIEGLLQRFISIKSINSNNNIQKQSNVDKNVNYQINY